MPAYTTITNGLVAVGAKPFATTIQALRDNPIAIAEGDPTAPVNTAAWHPYNKLINSDSNTGRIWSFSIDGAQATITTPDFANGWEYALLFDQVQGSSGTQQAVNINLYRETGAAYAGLIATGLNVSTAFPTNGWIELPRTRMSTRFHCFETLGRSNTASDTAGTIDPRVGSGQVTHVTAQRILRAQLSPATGTITGVAASQIFLYRRKDSGSQ